MSRLIEQPGKGFIRGGCCEVYRTDKHYKIFVGLLKEVEG